MIEARNKFDMLSIGKLLCPNYASIICRKLKASRTPQFLPVLSRVENDDDSTVANALVADINFNAADGYFAFADTGTLYIVNRAGTRFELSNIADEAVVGTTTVVKLLSKLVPKNFFEYPN